MKKKLLSLLPAMNLKKATPGNFIFILVNNRKQLEAFPHYWALIPVRVSTGKENWEQQRQ